MDVICDVVFFVEDVSTSSWFGALRAAYPSTTFHQGWSFEDILGFIAPKSSSWIVLVHGPAVWRSSLVTIAHLLLIWIFIDTPPCQLLPATWSWCTLRHVDCGGVLHAAWACACNSHGSFLNPAPSITSRRIRHIVNTATPGRFSALPAPHAEQLSYAKPWLTDSTGTLLDWNGLLFYDRPLAKIRCRSEFTSTKWTARGLSSKELCVAFDVPLVFHETFALVAPSLRHTLPFLRVAPTKLFKACWDRLSLPGGFRGPVKGHSGEHLLAPGKDTLSQQGHHHCSGLLQQDPPSVSSPSEAVNDRSGPQRMTAANKPEDADNAAVAINDEVGNFAKATKSDDAAVPVALWDDRIWALQLHSETAVEAFTTKWTAKRLQMEQDLSRGRSSTAAALTPRNPWVGERDPLRTPLTVLREAVCARWKLNVFRSLIYFLRSRHGSAWAVNPDAALDIEAGRECIERMADSDFWAWRRGSRCFFWRWHESMLTAIRDGFPIWVVGSLPENTRPQRCVKDPDILRQMRAKLEKVRLLGYIMRGFVTSLTNYFAVPKGEHDIRMVYDATKSKLNQALWVPSFSMPTVDSLTRQIEPTTWMADLDLGDMFLNFMLDAGLRSACGVDLRPLFSEEVKDGETLWERWVRCMMGLKPCPYVCVKAMLLGTEILYGDRRDPNNAYRWDVIVLNLPGSVNYNPQEPWFKRIRSDSGRIAGNTVTYVDDLRPMAESKEECWRVVHQTGSRLGYLGIQNAPRKTRPPSQTPGAWAGTVAEATSDGVGIKASQEKWDKGKKMLDELEGALVLDEQLEHKRLEQMRGFFIHIQRTYPNMTPFIKGMHLTLDGWRPGRDAEMWKCKPSAEGFWYEKEELWVLVEMESHKPPAKVRPAPRLKEDVRALKKLMEPKTPPTRLLRSKHISVAVYGFVDASGVGFGGLQTADGLSYRYGLWGRDADCTSSNYKELRNLVETVEEGVSSGELAGTELFIFTDNSTAEGAFYKGNTNSRFLFELVLRLRVLDMKASIILHVVHIAGTRMIAQGVDALSGGDQTEGVMAGKNILEFIPLNLNAIQRSPAILDWVKGWLPPKIEGNWLGVEAWFDEGHGIKGGMRNHEGIWVPTETQDKWLVWTPPPAIADVALEELATSRHKRTHLNHVFICPRLMTQRWRKMLHKVSDVVFEIPAGSRSFWPRCMHEPLIIGLTLRLVSCPPWRLRRSERILDMDRELRGLWKSEEGSELCVLRQLCDLPNVLEAM